MNDISNLLDGTLDDLADMPEFKPYPPGVHRATMKMEIVQVGDKKLQAVKVDFKALETVETEAGSDEVVTPGQTDNILCFLQHDNEQVVKMGQGQFKQILKALVGTYGDDKSPRELVEESAGCEVLIATGLRRDKKDKDKVYMRLDNIQVV